MTVSTLAIFYEKNIISFMFNSNSLMAQVTLPNALFGDNMVLQRHQKIAIFGKATTVANIEVYFKNKQYTANVKNGYWKVLLDESEAGGPFDLTIKGSNTITFTNILVGEVWLSSGQSNMQMPLKGFSGQPVNGSNEAILTSANSNLRFFEAPRKTADKTQEYIAGKWQLSSPKTSPKLSAAAYFFGKFLQETLDVPIGLIVSSWGGTPAEAWTPAEIIKKDFGDFKGWNENEQTKHRNPSVLYNAMIHPMIPYTIKGAIWYQGEGNVNRPKQYETLFPAMIESWRVNWGQGDFPFYFVQIAPFGNAKNHPFLREAQLKTMSSTKNTGMAVTLDIGEKKVIHPAEKKKVGERLAYWALAKDYGFNSISYSGPVYKSMEIKKNRAFLSFDYAETGVNSMGNELINFQIAGADKVFYPAKAAIKRGALSVWSDQVEKPIAVRYAWEAYVEASLFNNAGLPASSFRTDNW
ncbi:MAG: sialate O-acetylesterase [Glaciecola sp.]